MDNWRVPPGVTLRPLTRLDAWRFSNRTLLPRRCLGFVAVKDGKDVAAAMAAAGHGGAWWIAAWFFADTARHHAPSIYRIALRWLAGLSASGAPLLAIPDPGVAEPWFRHLGFVRNGDKLDGREVFVWVSKSLPSRAA